MNCPRRANAQPESREDLKEAQRSAFASTSDHNNDNNNNNNDNNNNNNNDMCLHIYIYIHTHRCIYAWASSPCMLLLYINNKCILIIVYC